MYLVGADAPSLSPVATPAVTLSLRLVLNVAAHHLPFHGDLLRQEAMVVAADPSEGANFVGVAGAEAEDGRVCLSVNIDKSYTDTSHVHKQ